MPLTRGESLAEAHDKAAWRRPLRRTQAGGRGLQPRARQL